MRKSGHYRRAFWLGDAPRNFGDLIEECIGTFAANTIPRFGISDSVDCIIARKSLRDGRRYLHFVSFEAGAPAAIISTAVQGGVEEIAADEQPAEPGHEYVQQQLFCLIERNHIVWATHNNAFRESGIQLLFTRLIETCGLGGDPANTAFGFQVVLDEDKVQELFQTGIKEIDLGVGALRPTLERIAHQDALPGVGVFEAVASLFHRAPTAEEIEAAQYVEGKFVLRPGRDWDRPEVLNLMATLSNAVREEYDDEFAIITKSGLRLTRDKMSLQRPFDVPGNKRVVASMQVDAALREMFVTLEEDGILDA